MLSKTWRYAVVRLLRFPNAEGIDPVKLFRSRASVVTRPALVVTPYQFASGLLLNQFVLFSQFAPSVALYSATSAALSPATLPCARAFSPDSRPANKTAKRTRRVRPRHRHAAGNVLRKMLRGAGGIVRHHTGGLIIRASPRRSE